MDPLPPLCNIYYAKAGALCYNETNTVFQSFYDDQQHRSVKYLFGISSILKRFLGDNNDKEIARYRGIVEQINALEPSMVNLTDDKLTGYTQKFRERLAQGETMEEILPEAFAVVRETSRRVLGMRHFDVQLIGGICLHEGRIAEMRTGEGKTLVATTDSAVPKIEKIVGISNLYAPENIELSHCFTAALRAKALMHRDRDYVVKGDEIIIVDEFTGRLMEGRRYSDGLHQAIEAKEGVKIQRESQTLASITFQNYFRMYDKLAGMTGTAKTEENEFLKIYKLPVIVIPTNKPIRRIDEPDVIYKTKAGKYRAVGQAVKEIHETGQPVLIGTTSIVQSEEMSHVLKKNGIPHVVLNAKFHEKEAEIVANAGQKGAVTIATNMAGRGTDIKLGEGVEELGGLYIVGTERHESRRIDNQLRGRSGRQGDPGASKFFLSLEDDLMRLFASDRIAGIMDRLGMDEDEPIEHAIITRSVEHAQKKVEARNFDIRKHVLEYDDVMNQQREVIYGERKKILLGENLRDNILAMVRHIIKDEMAQYANEKLYPEEWQLDALIEDAEKVYAPKGRLKKAELEVLARDEIQEELEKVAEEGYKNRELMFGEENMRELEKVVMLRVVDQKWMDHLDHMDMLREGINLRAYGQRNPLVEYKIEALTMFEEMEAAIMDQIASLMYHVSIVTPVGPAQEGTVDGSAPAAEGAAPLPAPVVDAAAQQRAEQLLARERSKLENHLMNARVSHGDESAPAEAKAEKNEDGKKIGRNDPCPCGSGKKYKNCHGKDK